MEFDPTNTPWQSLYKIITGTIVPRPIGWISSINADGRPNLAPFSYFNAVAAKPPTLVFSAGTRNRDGKPKDTYFNVKETGEFVANIVTEATIEAMNITATELPEEINEFEYAGLTPVASKIVKPPRVGESPVNYECKVKDIIEIGEGPGGGYLVIGEVVCIHVRDDLVWGGDKIDIEKLRPVGRLAGGLYTRVRDIFEVKRPPSQI
jgi:flavin reductase (DIM6/NTAB) family NADH-FMN oxidoreductase RutF